METTPQGVDIQLERILIVGIAEKLDNVDFALGDSLHAPISAIMTNRPFPSWPTNVAVPYYEELLTEWNQHLKITADNLVSSDEYEPLQHALKIAEEALAKVKELKQKFNDFPSFEKTGCKCIHDYAVLADEIHELIKPAWDEAVNAVDAENDGEIRKKFRDATYQLHRTVEGAPISVSRCIPGQPGRRQPYSTAWWNETTNNSNPSNEKETEK